MDPLLLLAAAGLGTYAYCRPMVLFRRALAGRLRAGGFRARHVQLPAARVRYWTGGRGEPVVFVHGFGTEAAVNWHAQLPIVRRRFQALAPDLPGFGGSERRATDWSVGLQVQCLRDLLDHVGVDRASFVGHSMGGWISLAFAAAYPDRIDRLILVDAAGLRFDPDLELQRVLMPETIDDAGRLLGVNFQRPPRVPRFVLRDLARTCRREASIRSEVLRVLVYGDEFLDDRLAHVTAPTLIVWGRSDTVTPLALGERLADGIPGSRLVVFDDCAHSPNVEQPARFNRLMLAFLAADDRELDAYVPRLAANS